AVVYLGDCASPPSFVVCACCLALRKLDFFPALSSTFRIGIGRRIAPEPRGISWLRNPSQSLLVFRSRAGFSNTSDGPALPVGVGYFFSKGFLRSSWVLSRSGISLTGPNKRRGFPTQKNGGSLAN